MTFTVLGEWETIEYLRRYNMGIARTGDGEAKLALGRGIKSQVADKNLAERMREVFSFPQDNPRCVVGIPNIYDGIKAENPKSQSFWTNMYERPSTHKFLRKNVTYFSSFITRPDNTSGINNATYYSEVMKLWEGRPTVLVRGTDIQFCKHPSFLEKADIIGEVLCPNMNAWAEYTRIFSECMKYPEDTLYLARLGPTATILAWDLGYKDRHCLDIGHLPMFYNRFMVNNPDEPEPEYLNYGKPMGT